jgi:Acyl-CoA dehydrogenase, C-terminal domain
MMDADEQAMFEKAVSTLMARFDGDVPSDALDDVGWLDILAEDPAVGVPAVFGAQGRAVGWSSALHDLLGTEVAGLGHDAPLAATSVVVPLPRSEVPGRRSGQDVVVEGLLLGARHTTEWLVVAATSTDRRLEVLQIPVRDAVVTPRKGLDPAVRVNQVTAVAQAPTVLAGGDRACSWWTARVAAGRRALSGQLCGVLTTMLESARAHAIERRQFGRPIGSFQAVRHKLAEAHAALSGALATADMAWESDDQPLASMTAKVVASRACATVAFHAQQVLAGVGFTAEHPHHRALKRAVLIDRILGDATDLSPVIGRELVTRRCAPRLVEL